MTRKVTILKLQNHHWPGNVRELFNCARYLTGLTVGDIAKLSDLPPRIRESSLNEAPASIGSTLQENPPTSSNLSLDMPAIRYDLSYKKAKRLWLEVFEYAYVTRLLETHDGNISHAARSAGIDRKSIQRLMKRNQMSSASKKEGDSE